MDLNEKTKKILESKLNINLLVDIIQEIYSEDKCAILHAIEKMQEIFCTLMTRGDFSLAANNPKDHSGTSSIEKYQQWLVKCYTETTDHFISVVDDSDNEIQIAVCSCLSAFVQSELELTKKSASKTLMDILEKVLNEERKMGNVITKLTCFGSLCSLKMIMNLMKQNKAPSEVFLWNVYFLLTHIQVEDNEVQTKEKNRSITCKLYSTIWQQFLKNKLPLALYKRVLIALYENILEQLWNPLLMTDFLTESYNIGGVVSLLALNGIFFLMQKFNLEYQDFYQKLYSLLEEEMLHVKYRARFFFLTDLFLTSTHLPAYLVAAFIKKLSRLSLVAPPDALVVLIPLIGNLLVRHPTLRFLIHRENSTASCDPYKENEDLANCHALESSLWELKSLQYHWHPDVSTKACFINKPLPSIEWDLSDLLESSYKELLEKEYGVPITEDIPIVY